MPKLSIVSGKKMDEKSGSFGCNNMIIILLLTSILAHGLLFSFGQSTKMLDTLYEEDHTIEYAHGNTQEQLPHWRLATDCSVYSFDCFARAQQDHKYLPYSFPSSLRANIEESRDSEVTASTTQLRNEWSMEKFDEIPSDWIQYLGEKAPTRKSPIVDRNYLYPPMVPEVEYQACLDFAINQNKSTIEQLDALLSGDSPKLTPEPETNMIAFTISDYSYVQDMLHEVFQMMDDVVGFSRQHFFLVAIDQQSAAMACSYGYTVVLWKADDNLKDAVANTKLILSLDLVKRGIDFFFSEMDVWWIRSPKQNLVDFQRRSNIDNGDFKHVYFSGHQNNFGAPNIGVYAVKANKYTEEYFRVCLDVLNEKPETHDQHVMAEVYTLFKHKFRGDDTYKFGGNFKPDGPPETPEIQNPFEPAFFGPHEVVADERPTTTHQTLAIHTLNGTPLQAPHGKKMIAKELGVYYGFHTHPETKPHARTVAAGYYDRSGEKRRYLWLDTSIRSNFYSIAERGRYHDHHAVEWTMAILMGIAKKTDRILVLPQVFDADMDAGVYFAWQMMDYSKVSEMIDFRETNFLSNPKAWKKDANSKNVMEWPFETVANTALFKAKGENNTISIYTQFSKRSSIISKKVWTSGIDDTQWLDAWLGSLSTLPDFKSAEVLLVNPDVLMDGNLIWNFARRMREYREVLKEKGKDDPTLPLIGTMEREISEIYSLLGWCWDVAFRHTANKASASHSCYGIGTPSNH